MKELLVCMAAALTAGLSANADTTCDPSRSVECRARGGLPNARAKLRAGETVRLAYLGGSITKADPGWRAMTRDWFAARFPKARIEAIDAGIPGTGSDFGAFRLTADVLTQKPDLLFVEFRVNGSGGFDCPSVESIVRQTWTANPRTDICFVYTLDEGMLPALSAGRQTAFGTAMETVCNRYGIPSIDFAPEILKRLAAGEIAFRPSADAPPKDGAVIFTKDGVHPYPAGHALYRDVVARAMETAIFPASGMGGRAHALPSPIAKDAWPTATLVPSAQVLTGAVWRPIDVERDSVYAATREPMRTQRMLRGGVWTDREGVSFTLAWTGSTIGFSDIPQSREDPMALEVSIDGGKPQAVTRMRTTPHLSSRFWYLPVQTWGEHTATVTLKRLPKGQRWLLGQFLVTGTLHRPDSIRLHSRHIPDAHLRHTPFSLERRTETLSDVLEPDKIGDFAKWGVDTIELRLCWWALEKTPGVLDFSRFDADLARVEAAGLKGGLMCWFFFPPDGCKDIARFNCTKHHEDATLLSPWDPESVRVADRLYGATAARYGTRIDFVYVMSCGDYGEPMLPCGVKHYKFSSPHSHGGVCWAGDRLARAAWAKVSPLPVEDVLSDRSDRATRLKYMDFLQERVADYTAENFAVVRKRFPWARYGLPIGGGEENCGNSRSLTIKRVCEVSTNITVRWTSLNGERDFGLSNVFARRVSSACRFYGCAFGEEIASPSCLTNATAFAHSSYEVIANAATMLHNDYLAMDLCGDDLVWRLGGTKVSPPETDIAVLWPDIDLALYAVDREVDPHCGEQPPWIFFYNLVEAKARKMRMHTDYEVCDTRMIRDGFLEKMKIRKLVSFGPLAPETEAALAGFRARGGEVSDGMEYLQVPERVVYRTRHRDYDSSFEPATGKIEFHPKGSLTK